MPPRRQRPPVHETYAKVAGVWRYVYPAVDQFGQVIDICLSRRRDLAAAQRFFEVALKEHGQPAEVGTDKAPSLIRTVEELIPRRPHDTDAMSIFGSSAVTVGEGRAAADARPTAGPNRDVVIQGHAFVQTSAGLAH